LVRINARNFELSW